MKARTLLLLLLAAALPGAAQTAMNRWGSYKTFPYGPDRVDRGTLNLHLEFPLFNRATVGNAQVKLELVYDSNYWQNSYTIGGWRLAQATGQLVPDLEDGGYCGFYDPVTGEDDYTGNPDNESEEMWSIANMFYEPDGTVWTAGAFQWLQSSGLGGGHNYRGWVSDCPTFNNNTDVVIPDGKGYQVWYDLQGDATAYDAAGDQIAVSTNADPPTANNDFVDPNGNVVSSAVSGGVTTYSDPLGAAVTVTPSGSQVLYTYTGPNGPATVTEDLVEVPVSVQFGCAGEQAWNGSLDEVADLKYPDGSKYTFNYDSNGRLSWITLPSGATISYTMTYDCTDHGNDSLTRKDSVNNGNGWSWSRTLVADSYAADTTETDPAGDKTLYDFAAPLWTGISGVLTSAAVYNSSSQEVSATTITTSTEWDSPNYVVSQQTTSTEPYNNGTASGRYAVSTVSYNVLGGPVTEDDYDWGVNSTGAGSTLLRSVATTYTEVGAAELPASVSGGGGETTFSYDSHGNPTTVHEYVTGSTYLTKSFAYNANGTVHTATDVNGGVTTYTYGDCGGIFPTQVQTETTASTTLTTTMAWNCAGGVETSSTDANGFTTTTGYADPANTWRPTSVTAPDGGETKIAYTAATSSGVPAAVEQAMDFGSSARDVLTTLDGLGRPILSQRRQGPGPGTTSFDTVETTYDPMDRVSTVSMPYTETQGKTAPNGTPVTTTTYDALSRPTLVTDGDSGTVAYTYTTNDVKTTLGTAPGDSSPTKSRQEEFDGLGRLESVCEMTSASGSGTCGQTAGQTGFWTKYTRNSAGNITGVTQNAQGTPIQTRSFAFDELGRMTSETNPESGTTSYTFDTDTTCGSYPGDLVKRVDANGNLTCYDHDLYHRVKAIIYSSGPNASATPVKSFVYGDTVSGGVTVDGVAMLNAKGRLAEAYTTSHATDLGFSYPSADEEKVYQTSPNSSGWYITDATRYPNGAPDTLSMPGVPEMTYGLDPEGRTSTVSAASGQNPVTAATYSALGLTAATLGSSDTDGYTYDAGTGRMSQYQFAVDGATDTGKLGWNTNGTLASLAITDSIPGTGDTQTCNYTHDDLARLATASCGSAWSQTFGYDPFGNLTKSGTQSFSATYTNNRISGNTNYTVTYDSDGNLEDDPITGNPNSFDAEGKAVTLENVAVTFDALGRAVEAAESGGTIEFLYGPGGSKLAVMSGQTLKRADIPLPTGGEAVYTSSGLAYYRHADHLGSSRLASTSSRTLYSSTAYAPYGEAYDQAGTADKSFTGQKQDINSTASGGQYDFLMREQNPIQGRWWTPDPAGFAAVNPANPQSWNRYAYVGGVPTSLVDPMGLDPCASVRLERPGGGTSADGENADFGPYDPGGDDAAAEQSGGGCQPQECMLDGADIDCGFLGIMEAEGGGWGGGGSPSVLATYGCLWSDCLGAEGEIDQWGNPTVYNYVPPGSGGCQADPGNNQYNCFVSTNTTGLNGPQTAPALAQCGWNTACSITPINPSTGQENDSEQGLQALAGGYLAFTHPFDTAIVNGWMFFTGAALVAAGAGAFVAGCLDPTPVEPLTCAAGATAALEFGGSGAGILGFGGYFLDNVTVPAFEEWWQ